MKPYHLCYLLTLCFLTCQVIADDPADQKLSALQCMDACQVNQAIASKKCAVYGQAQFADTSRNTRERLGIEWFQAKHQRKGWPMLYSESRNIYSGHGRDDNWEQYLVNGKEQYLIRGPLSREMRPLEFFEDPETHEIEYRLQPSMPCPNAFAMAFVPNTSFTTHSDSDAKLSGFLDRTLDFYSEDADGEYVTGIWVTKKFYVRYKFDKSCGYMPVRVLGFFADHKQQLAPGLAPAELFKNPAFSITTKWKKYEGKQTVYLPVEIINTVHKLNANAREGQEGHFRLAWQVREMSDEEFEVNTLNDHSTTAKLRQVRDELSSVLEKEYSTTR